MSATVTVENLVKRYSAPGVGTPAALNDVSLTLGRGELTVLLGPSGCGKTTLLRSIGGLIRPDAGTIRIDDQLVFSARHGVDVATRHRHVGMVFQSYALWPNLTVFENVAFPLKEKKTPRETIKRLVADSLRLVDCEQLQGRYPHELSGGQQQRTALARALVAEPRLLLLDEPLSNLDAGLRVRMRAEIKRVQQRTGQTMIHVTHDQGEALALADRLVVLRAGEVLQVGAPRELYADPGTAFVAEFLGSANLVEVSRYEQGIVDTALGPLKVGRDHFAGRSGTAYVVVRQEDVHVGTGPCSRGCGNELRLKLQSVEYLGDHQTAVFGTDVTISAWCRPDQALVPQDEYTVCLPVAKTAVVPS